MDAELLKRIMVCKGCHAIGGRDILILKKKRCPLCGRLTQKFELEPKEKKGKKAKDVKRFPRELAPADALQEKTVKLITDRARDFDCPGAVINITKGPVVTEYEFAPDRFTRVKKLKSINEDLALALSVDTVTIRRIAGKAAIGIAIPNADRKEVTFDECLKNVIAHRDDMEVPLNFGIMSDGTPYVEDLAKYPHLLIGGTTGSGKSVLLNCLLTSLLYVRSPKQLQLALIDPKSVELFPYKGLPHLMENPVCDVYQALSIMDRIEQEMRRRTSNLHVLGANNIRELNARIRAEGAQLKKDGHTEQAERRLDDQWPYIVMVIDEMADLVLSEKKMFTEKLAAISQMARAAGICVISATQRPSVDVLPGKIKVNFPARASFRMPSQVDSKTVLNYKGAETLLGKGDMFLVSPDRSGLQRIHVPHLRREDRDRMLKISLEYGHVNTVPADAVNPVPEPAAKKNSKQPVRVN